MNWNDYFEIRLTIEDVIESVHIQIESVNQFRMKYLEIVIRIEIGISSII